MRKTIVILNRKRCLSVKDLSILKSIVIVFSIVFSLGLHAQDQRDDEIFGAEAPKSEAAKPFLETLQIGGRLEVRSNSAQAEAQKFPESSYSQLKRADVYFDSRPNSEFRALMRMRFSEEKPLNPVVAATANGTGSCTTCIKTEFDELWFKWDALDTLYFTLGKQHLKWGSGRIWNPTDFTSSSTRDPFALFDSRLGQELLKIHLPVEKQGFNYYAVFQFDDAQRNDDVGAALRGEFAFGGIGEAALSFQTRKDQPIRYGLDISSGVGPIDIYAEAARSKRETRTFYEGGISPELGVLPTEMKREDDSFNQIVGGAEYTLRYLDDDNATIGVEYFDNGLGYSDRELELYSLVLGQSSSLYAGRRYAGTYLRLPSPGSFNDTSFYVNGLRNLSDETTVARLTVTWQIYKTATFEAFGSQCFGDYGELCFRIPEKFQSLASNPILTEDQRTILAALPSRRVKTMAGIAMNMEF